MAKINVLYNRRPDSNKGDYGHIFALAGSLGFTGAAVLCVRSAMRTGAGLVTLGIPKSLVTIVARQIVESMTKPLPETSAKTLNVSSYKEILEFSKKVDVLAIGPGLSRNPSTQKLVRKVILGVRKPMVIDADGLNALAGHLNLLRTADLGFTKILTPHPGEFSRLVDRPVAYIQKNRQTLAKSFACRYNVVLVLKGKDTIVSSPTGRTYTNKTGNPGMATAGSGDCLTGIIAALLAEGFSGFEAAKLGVYLHGLAGDLAAKDKTQAGMIASDIIEKIPAALKIAKSKWL